MCAKQVPLIEVAKLHQERRQLRENTIVPAEKQVWLVEKARLVSALQERGDRKGRSIRVEAMEIDHGFC